MPEASVNYETHLFEMMQLNVRQALSRNMLQGLTGVRAEQMIEHMSNQIIMQLRAFVLADPRRDYRKTHTFTYLAAHPTWKHQLVASLPEGSFRRRWCHYFWEIPFDYANTKVTKTVDVHVPTIFPESTMRYPEQLGRPHHPIEILTNTTTESIYGQCN